MGAYPYPAVERSNGVDRHDINYFRLNIGSAYRNDEKKDTHQFDLVFVAFFKLGSLHETVY